MQPLHCRRSSAWIASLVLSAACCLLAPFNLAAWQNEPLTISVNSLPNAEAGVPYHFNLRARGGVAPYQWGLGNGSSLPPGLHLASHSGNLTGTPRQPGEYHFTLTLSDIDAPPSQVQREFKLVVVAGLTVQWKTPPHVSGVWIAGSLIVANHTDQAANLTVIVVAVNQIGRATALGYQHFTIDAQKEQEIPFGATPGPGAYVVRADAVAHFSTGKTTLRAHKQTEQGELVVRQI